MTRSPYDAYKSVVVVVDTTSQCWTYLCGAPSWGRTAHRTLRSPEAMVAPYGSVVSSKGSYSWGSVSTKVFGKFFKSFRLPWRGSRELPRADTQAVPLPSGYAARTRAGCVLLGSASHGLFRGHLHPVSWNSFRYLLLEFTGTWSASNRLPSPRRSARHESLSRITRQHECHVVPGQAFENRPWRGLHSGELNLQCTDNTLGGVERGSFDDFGAAGAGCSSHAGSCTGFSSSLG